MRITVLILILTFAHGLFGQFTNYRVSNESAVYPEEVTIALNPLQPSVLAAGSNLDYFYSSEDSGKTWNQYKMTSVFGVWGDPVTLFDASGNLYYVHLSNPADGYWIDRIVIQKSTDNGATFNDGTHTGVFYPHNQDKAWIAADLTNSPYRNNLYVTWTEFDDYGSNNPNDSSRILFSRSTDFAESWSEPVRINDVNGDCVDSDNTVEGAVPAVGPNGEIYVAWSGPLGIMFDKSTDGGVTWGEDVFVSEQPGGWDYPVSGIYRANGLPVTACDTSSHSPYKGNIYVLWTDTRNGAGNPDVFISKSTDDGESWSEAVRVNNDDTEREQFFAWLAIDQTNGNLYASFYDRRNTDGDYTEYWFARSTDGGDTWDNYCLTDSPFPTGNGIFIGDYTNIAAYDGVIHPVWTKNEGNNLVVMTAVVRDENLVDVPSHETKLPSDFRLYQNYPNPFNPTTTIKYSIPNVIASDPDLSGERSNLSDNQQNQQIASDALHPRNDANVRLIVYNILGEEIATLVNEKQSPGNYNVMFNAAGLPSGTYFCKLQYGNFVAVKKMLLLK